MQMDVKDTEGESDKRSVGHEEEQVASETWFSTRPSVHSKQTGQSLARLQLLCFGVKCTCTPTQGSQLQYRAQP